MVIYSKFLWALLGLVCLGIDITVFFVCIRIVLMWKNIAWLGPFDDAGKRLVDTVTDKVGNWWNRTMKKQLADKGKLLVGLIAMEFVRLIICQIARWL